MRTAVVVGASCPLGVEICRHLGSLGVPVDTHSVLGSRIDVRETLPVCHDGDVLFWLAQSRRYSETTRDAMVDLSLVNVPAISPAGARPRMVVFASSGSIGSGTMPWYEASKQAGEKAAERIAPTASFRIYSMFGQPRGLVHQVVARARSGAVVDANEHDVVSPVYVYDVAEAMVKAALWGRTGVFHAAGPSTTLRHIATCANPSVVFAHRHGAAIPCADEADMRQFIARPVSAANYATWGE